MADDDPRGVERERDFYRQLLDLAAEDYPDPSPFLRRVLASLVQMTRANEGYIELTDEHEGVTRSWSASSGVSEERAETIQAMLSRGIMAQALATGELILTVDAGQDLNFKQFESVQRHGIQSVVCAPIGKSVPIGVVYLQGRNQGAAPYVQREVDYVRFAAAHIAPLAETLVQDARNSEVTIAEPAFGGLVIRSKAMKEVLEPLRLYAKMKSATILLNGPSGCGKTLLGGAIHRMSGRTGALVEVNCAAIQDNLFESDLFGAVPGAYTGCPPGGIRGKVAAADGGTLFLDEIAELSPTIQAKLLQLIQSKVYYQLGSPVPQNADVKLVAATNQDLRRAVREGRFREDLFHRLNGSPVKVPGLSQRPEDIVPLATKFVRETCENEEWDDKRLSESALRWLLIQDWPGNVRELQNVVRQAVVQAHLKGSSVVDVHHFQQDAEDDAPLTFHRATQLFQRGLIQEALTRNDWNISKTARDLDIVRSHLHSLIKLHGLERPR